MQVSLRRSPDVRHHLSQGTAWLEESANGTNTTLLCYAALEFRLAIERIGLQYWTELMPSGLEENDLRDLRSFKRIENRIYELAGHQKEIDAFFSFNQILLRLLKVPQSLPTPKLGELSRYWHECSELCHVAWSLAAGDSKLAEESYAALRIIESSLIAQTSGFVSWPRIADASFDKLRKNYMSGVATEDNIREYLEVCGIWGRVEFQDGTPSEFIGESIPPRSS